MKLLIPFAAAVLALAPFTAHAQDADHHHDDSAMPMKPRVPASKGLNVNFQGKVTTFTIEQLISLPQVTIHVHNAHRNTDEEYSGPLVSTVLEASGLTSNKETQPLILHSSVVGTGTDKYFVLYSCAELEPAFSKGQAIIAIAKSGLPDEEGGMIQLINTSDAKPARWVHGLTNLNVMSVAAQ